MRPKLDELVLVGMHEVRPRHKARQGHVQGHGNITTTIIINNLIINNNKGMGSKLKYAKVYLYPSLNSWWFTNPSRSPSKSSNSPRTSCKSPENTHKKQYTKRRGVAVHAGDRVDIPVKW